MPGPPRSQTRAARSEPLAEDEAGFPGRTRNIGPKDPFGALAEPPLRHTMFSSWPPASCTRSTHGPGEPQAMSPLSLVPPDRLDPIPPSTTSTGRLSETWSGRESGSGRRGAPLHALQFRPRPSNNPRHTCDGGQCQRSCLVDEEIVRLADQISSWWDRSKSARMTSIRRR